MMRMTLTACAVLLWFPVLLLAQAPLTQPDVERPGEPMPEYESPPDGSIQEQINELQDAMQRLIDENGRLKAQVRRLNRAIDDLATKSPGNGGYVPKIFGNMVDDSGFRDEVMRTNQGKLIIDNRMGRPITYYVNGARWRIPEGEHSVHVPLGIVRTHTTSEITRSHHHWRLSDDGQHYEMRISIRPQNSVPRGI